MGNSPGRIALFATAAGLGALGVEVALRVLGGPVAAAGAVLVHALLLFLLALGCCDREGGLRSGNLGSPWQHRTLAALGFLYALATLPALAEVVAAWLGRVMPAGEVPWWIAVGAVLRGLAVVLTATVIATPPRGAQAAEPPVGGEDRGPPEPESAPSPDPVDAHAGRLVALGGLLSGMVRELTNPIGSVQGFLQLALERPGIDGELRQDLVRALVEARRCQGVVEQLLAFAAGEDRSLQVVDLEAAVEEMIRLVGGPFRFGAFSLEWIRSDRPLPVRAGPHRLRQVVLNLLSRACANAVKGGWHVEVRTLAVAGRARLEVADDGPGMEPARAAILFQAASQGEGGHLGLVMAGRIVEELGGTLECVSSPGVGATFIMELPGQGIPADPGGDRAVPAVTVAGP